MESQGEDRPNIVVWPAGPAGFRRLVERFQDPLVRYAFRRLGRIHDAEDVVQDVFTKAYARLGNGAQVSSAVAYLFRMAANACTDVLRRRKRAALPLEAGGEVPDVRRTAAEEAAARDELQRVERLLARLSREQAEVLRMRVLDGFSFAEIAAALGKPIGTIKSRFRYGLLALRVIVDEEKEVQG